MEKSKTGNDHDRAISPTRRKTLELLQHPAGCLSACGHAQADGLSCLLARGAHASGDYPSAWLRTGSEQLTFFPFPEDGGWAELVGLENSQEGSKIRLFG